jgi:hypothetical protein
VLVNTVPLFSRSANVKTSALLLTDPTIEEVPFCEKKVSRMGSAPDTELPVWRNRTLVLDQRINRVSAGQAEQTHVPVTSTEVEAPEGEASNVPPPSVPVKVPVRAPCVSVPVKVRPPPATLTEFSSRFIVPLREIVVPSRLRNVPDTTLVSPEPGSGEEGREMLPTDRARIPTWVPPDVTTGP